MKWSPSLFSQLNNRVVSGAGLVNLQMRNVKISSCTCVPSSRRYPCSFQLGKGVVDLQLTYRPLTVPSDRFGRSPGMSAYVREF